MKLHTHILLSALLATSATADDDQPYRNKILQIIENPVNPSEPTYRFLNPIDPEGTSTAPEGVNGTSVFQLWTLHETTGAEYMLDEKTVSSYHPQAEISITSQDPYTLIPRTRVDQPFNVTYNVSGIITNDPNVQDAAKSVIFDHRVFAYAPGETAAADGASYTTHDHDPITQNGEHTITGLLTELTAQDTTAVRGEEIFSIFANPDFGVVGASLLATVRVQIWPLASGTISGVDPAKKYGVAPTIQIRTVDLYPNSKTFLRYYKTNDPTNPATSGVIGNRTAPSDLPFSKNWKIKKLDRRLKEDGTYTLELLHTTVFNTIPLGTVQLTIDKTVKINGGVNSSE